MADPLPSFIAEDILHSIDLNLFELLDPFTDSSFNSSTHTASDNIDIDIALPAEFCWQYSPSSPALQFSTNSVDAGQTEEICNPAPPNSASAVVLPLAVVELVRQEMSDEKTAVGNQGKAQNRKAPKREREPRIAIVVESEVDDLPDGYKWRKYGQKAVKNSPYPRSYYRCAENTCSVKKRKERSPEDPRMVVLTYQGQHNHYSHLALFGAEFAYLAQPPVSALQMPPQLYTPTSN